MTDPTPFPDDWRTQIAGDSEDNLKSLEGFESPAALGTAYFDQSAATKAAKDANWRDPFSNGDEKSAKLFERYLTPADLGKSLLEKEAVIRASSLLKPLADDPTDDDLKAYREQQGVPLEFEGYYENLPKGVVIGEDDKAIVDSLIKEMHEENASPALVNRLIGWYNKWEDSITGDMDALDKAQKAETEDSLREEWGSDFRANEGLAAHFLQGLSKEKQAELMGARMSDNRRLSNDPEFQQWMAKMGRELYGTQVYVPSGGQSSLQNRDARKAELAGWMHTAKWTDEVEKEHLQILQQEQNEQQRAQRQVA